MKNKNFETKLIGLPVGSFDVIYNSKRYLVTKELYSNDKIIKIYAQELGGNDIVSGNYFLTIKDGLLKPCEMSEQKVIGFVLNLKLIEK